MADFEQALTGQKSIIATWYAQATRELLSSEQTDMFSELIEAAREYGKQAKGRIPGEAD